jgi:cyclic pyranopterin monophosphate synthase
MPELTHFDEQGASRMVDVGDKPPTSRRARASGLVRMAPATLARIRAGELSKGDVLEVARLAGIMAAKQTAQLIPLCHTLPLDGMTISYCFPDESSVSIEAEVRVTARTGVEMEALTAVAVAGLAVVDMVKALDKAAVITDVRVTYKAGGRSGEWSREGARDAR